MKKNYLLDNDLLSNQCNFLKKVEKHSSDNYHTLLFSQDMTVTLLFHYSATEAHSL